MDADLERLATRARTRVGTSVRGKYLIDRLVGVGAMGAVYECTHRNGLRAALKLLHPEVARVEEVRTRFLREGRIANRIQHPGVVRVFDDDETEDGLPFIVMELLEGKTVEAEFRQNGNRIPLTRVVQIIDSLLDILDAAHAAGVVHRDLKPDNLFLTSGALKVLDFGIARLADSLARTKSGEMMGTPEFVAPEQAAGRVREIDARTDIFSVGAVMFTLISGQYVQRARGPLEYMVYAATKPARLTFEVCPEIEPAIAHVIDTALSFEKQKRWASARQMQTAVRSAAAALEPTLAANAAAVMAEVERRRGVKRAAQPPEPQISSTGTARLPSAENDPIPLKQRKP